MKRFLTFTVIILLCGARLLPGLALTTPVPQSSLAFEVASIKPVKAGPGLIQGGGCRGSDNASQFAAGPLTMGVGRCRFLGISLKNLISIAYGGDHFSITGGQEWMDADRFEIEAKSEDSAMATRAQLLQMTQVLIVDQFHLKFHRETKEVPGINLVVSKDGPKWKAVRDTEPPKGTTGGRGQLTGYTTAAALAQILSRLVGDPITDQTGLTGRYEINLKWSPEQPAGITDAASEPSGPSIFTALQEQLGLRLSPQKIPVEIFIIDSAERPKDGSMSYE